MRGLRYTIDPANSLQRIAGLDEREILFYVRRETNAARVAVDIGGAEGWYALFFASRPEIENVVAFEPEAHLRRRLKENFALNDSALIRKVDLRGDFVGDRTGEGWCRLDDVLASVDGPFLLKVDVDGGELDVLHGARMTLTTKTCRLVVETHSLQLEKDCVAYMEGLGYGVQIIPNAWYRRFVPESRHTGHNRWFLAGKPAASAS